MTNASFKALKEKVGVDDIAYSLGYRLKREAGVGKYIEMALPDGRGGNTDTLVISNPKSKVSQLYFHRSGAKGGDVVDLIMENINSFSESGKDKWEKAQKVMAKFANEPIPDYGDSKYLEKAGYKDNQPFDPNRWEVTPATEHMHHVMSYFEPRGIRQETVEEFAPYLVRVKDLQAKNYDNFNLGFPYKVPGSDEVAGYEIRGYKGYKSKAAGTNSSSAAWIVDMSDGNPDNVKKVDMTSWPFINLTARRLRRIVPFLCRLVVRSPISSFLASCVIMVWLRLLTVVTTI